MTRSSLIFAATSTLLLAACSGGGAATYPMSSEDAVAKLLKADAKVVAMGGEVSVSSPASNVVMWTMGDARAPLQCTATVSAAGDTGSTVKTSCTGSSPSDGAAASATGDMVKTFLDEHVASTLLDQPFNARKVEMAAVASLAKSLPAMQKDALQMDADTQAVNEELAEMVEADDEMVIGETEDTDSIE